MRIRSIYMGALLTGLVLLPLAQQTKAMEGQAFAGALAADGAAGGANTPDGRLYADGTRAINAGRWQDAETIFAKVVSLHDTHADGALYWEAYAENKQGHTNHALETCAELRREFQGSSWIHECGALEIEIHARSGKPAEPKAGDDDDLKLLALNSLMQKDETGALGQIQEILNSNDSSEKLRKEALFILGHHYSNATYAQIVRISYVEGDVRIARGEQNERPAGTTWEKAVADIPLETGFSLVTGAGRAEIEFEDASTLYLGENSVLSFNDLHTTSGIPHSEMALLTGTVTLHVHPSVAGEVFALKTPTDELTTSFTNKTYFRVSSYADAMGISGRNDGVLHLAELGDEKFSKGQTLFFREGVRVDPAGTESENGFADWDKWVADRVEQRRAAMVEMMKATGLTSPIPGLAELKDQGTFFDCAPYGTCWEPKVAEDAKQPDDQVSQERPSAAKAFGQPAQVLRTSFIKRREIAAAQVGTSQNSLGPWDQIAYFPCLPDSLRYRVMKDPVTGKDKVVETSWGPNPFAYRWAVCHAGSWVHRRHHYVWVPGRKMHHLTPIRWVKSGRTVAFVPLHPYDVKGKPPINQKEEVFAVNNRNGITLERVRLDAGRPIEELKAPPKEYRAEYLRPLPRADIPHMEVRSMRDSLSESKGVVAKAGIPLTFDPKLQSFMMAKQEMKGGKTTTVMAPVANRGGNLQARGGSFAGGHGGSSGGGGGYRGSSSGGGGSHSGGGSSGGGGGSHGGGGGGSTAASSTSSSSSSAASSAASSSSSHH
jgi:hypothetical protein